MMGLCLPHHLLADPRLLPPPLETDCANELKLDLRSLQAASPHQDLSSTLRAAAAGHLERVAASHCTAPRSLASIGMLRYLVYV